MKVAKVIGIPELNAKLKALAASSKKNNVGAVYVGYSQAYAIYVHEVQAKHKEGKSWKYLEYPFRRLAPIVIPAIVAKVYVATGSLLKGLLVAGLRVQRESQLIVPIDTSALKASAFTAREGMLATVSAAAQARGIARYDQQQAKRKVKKEKKEKSSKSGSKKGPVSSSRRWRRNTGGL